MKRKKIKKLSSLVLSVLLVITMLPTMAFAQDNSSDVKLLEESAFQSYLESDEAINENDGEIDLSNLPDARDFNANASNGTAPEMSAMTISDEETFEIANELDDTKEFKAQEDGQQIAAENFTIDVEQIMGEKQSSPAARSFSDSTMTRAIGNNDPNSAIYLPPSYFGNTLSNAATNNEDWYYFEATANSRQTILFSQQASGQYALVLYKLDESTGALTQVNLSAYSGTSQMIEHIDTTGYYFLRILPLTAPTTSYNYNFVVYVSYNHDSYEFNDSYDTATAFSNSINVTATIDNPYDEDWYKLTLTSKKDMDVTATYGQANTYAVFLYDSNLNSLGSFYMDGVTRSLTLSAGTYYARAVSYTGSYSDTAKYTLKIAAYVAPYSGTQLASGHYVRLSGNTLYINDVAAQINGTYMSYEYYSYRVSESITNFGDLSFWGGVPLALRHTYFTDGIGTRTSAVVGIEITNGYYHCFNNKNGYWSHYFDTDTTRPLDSQTTDVEKLFIFVDLNTGKVVDNAHSMHYTAPWLYSIAWKDPTLW